MQNISVSIAAFPHQDSLHCLPSASNGYSSDPHRDFFLSQIPDKLISRYI